MERTFTYQKPSNFFDETSEMETVSCNYVGPAQILVVVSEDNTWSIEQIPGAVDGVYPDLILDGIEEDFSIPETTDRYAILNATNDNHVPLMQFIAGEEVTEPDSIAIEDIGTFTHTDGTTFVLRYEDSFEHIDPIETLNDDKTLIDADNNVDYAFNWVSVNDDILIDGLDQSLKTSAEKKEGAETVAMKKLWQKHIDVLNWIKSDIIGTVPSYKLVIPNIIDVECGGTFEVRNI